MRPIALALLLGLLVNAAHAANDWVSMLAADPTGGLVTGRYCYSTNGKDISCDAGAAAHIASDTLYIPTLSAGSIGAGNINASGQITATAVGATLISATAPTGTVTATNIYGGTISATALYVGGVAVTPGGGGTPGGADTEVQYNSSGAFAGEAAFTYNATTNTLTADNLAGTLTTAAQANITSVGTLTGLTMGGDITATGHNISTTNLFASSVSGSTGTFGSIGAGAIAMTGNLTGAPLISTSSGGIVTATYVNAYQVSATNISATLATVTDITATGYYYGNGSRLTGVVAAPGGSTDQVQYNNGMSLAGSSNFTWTNAASLLDVFGIISATSVNVTGTTGTVSATNVYGLNISATHLTVGDVITVTTGVGTVTATNVNAFNVSATVGTFPSIGAGNINASGQITATALGATLISATAPTGTVTSTFVNAYQVSATNISTTALYVNGVAVTGGGGGGGTPGGADTEVQYNSSGAFAGEAAFTYNATTNTLTADNLAGTLTTAAQANVTSVGTLTGLTMGGDITATGFYISTTNLFASSVSGSTGTFGSLTIGGNTATTGSGSSGRVAYWSGTNALTSDANFTYSSGLLTVQGISTTTNQASFTTIYASGNVGIGTSSPNAKLDITGNVSATGGVSVTGAGYFGGNVGMGTTAPTHALDVYKSSGGAYVGYKSAGSSSGLITGVDASGNGYLWNYDTKNVYLGNANATALTIDSSNNIGIGTTSPAARLQVSGSFIVSTSAQNTTPTLYVNTSGNVGIGTSSPAQSSSAGRTYLSLQGSAVDGALEFLTAAADADNNGIGTIQFTDKNSTGADKRVAYIGAGLQGTTANNRGGYIRFLTKADNGSALSEQIRIDNAGSVGIGTTSPTTKLDVSGTILSRVYNAGSGTTIDFSQSNVVYTSAACGAFTLQNMQDGGSYMLGVTGSGTGPATFTHSGLTVKTTITYTCTSGKHTIFSFVRMGSNVYVTMITGY